MKFTGFSEEFLTPYRAKVDAFPDLLARVTYLTKYCRDRESWTDTVVRVVTGNVTEDVDVTQEEAALLFDAIWHGKGLPPGRGLWTGGVPGIVPDARYNCWYTTLRTYRDWCWVANQLMLGGGVGVGLQSIENLPPVNDDDCGLTIVCSSYHPNFAEVAPECRFPASTANVVDDSREGWVEALYLTLDSAFRGLELILDVSKVRARGERIRTFGGIACGPGPLVSMLRAVWRIVRGAAGRQLNSVECLDITNYVGLCIKSGNVRRSALITLGNKDDQAFRDAKKDFEAVKSHRHTSNNSIAFRSWREIGEFDWDAYVTDVQLYGEPGLLNLPLIWSSDPDAEGVNPCFTADTRIATQFGMVPISTLERKKSPLKVTTDTRVLPDYVVGSSELEGTAVRSAEPAFLTSSSAEVFELVTRRGYSVKATAYHKFTTPDGFVELRNLNVGDSLLLQSGEGQWGTEGSEDLGTIIGCIEGDGNFHGDRDKVTLRFWGEKWSIADRLLPACRQLADTIPSINGRNYSLNLVNVESRNTVEITSGRLAKALAEVGYRSKGSVPEIIWRGNRDCVRGYVRGLFATDGHVEWSKQKQCFSIRLSQSNSGLLREVQALLLNFGILSTIYLRRESEVRNLPDGNGGQREYKCETQYDLVISKRSAVGFAEQIGFLLESNETKYQAWKDSWRRGPYKEEFVDEVVSITSVGHQPVYCTTQPSHHTVIANGIVTGQCGEQALHNKEACNLGEVFPALIETEEERHLVVSLMTRYCIRQRLAELSDKVSDDVRKKNMRIGVGIGGICDFDWTADLPTGPGSLRAYFNTVRTEATIYAKCLGVNPPITVTTVKPSGTISLLNGSSPGIHAPYAPYYIRRFRTATNDPLAPALMAAGVPYELCVYDSTGNTLVFEFPVARPGARSYVVTETIREQFERQVQVQEAWADNAVSATLSFGEGEREELISCLRTYMPRLKSTSVLPKAHGYVQAPYEEISEDEYLRRHAAIDHDAPLVHGGEVEVEECAGGVCPVR